uniref:Uncharacterized protein n=1 Tax=Globisporangium ultimum (strain ATCC 200006 / CBS 805.95 / DAOM BR144) TaxID=431595 RepID=K3X9J1_GLOUD
MVSTSGVRVVRLSAPSSSLLRRASAAPPSNARAQVAVYAGMAPEELAAVIHRVLRLPRDAECTGFLVVENAHQQHDQQQRRFSKKKRNSHAGRNDHQHSQRIVPLSLACIAPELLSTQGDVTAMVVYADVADDTKSANDKKHNGLVELSLQEKTKKNDVVNEADAVERIGRFIVAVCEDKTLSKFEAAVLAELCEQQQSEVLKVMRSNRSVAQKKQYLLDFVHATGHPDAVVTSSATHSFQNGFVSKAVRHSSPQRLSSKTAAATHQESAVSAQLEVVYAKLVSIARTVFSPQVQNEILDTASSFREKPSQFSPHLTEASCVQKTELLNIIEKLLNKHALPEEQSAYLIQLVLKENRLLLSALQSYKSDYNLNDLEKTIKQIAALGSVPPSANGHSATKATSLKKRTSPRKTKTTPKAPIALKGFVPRPIDILHSLHQKQMITSLEYDILGALVKQHDPQVLAAIDEYHRTRDQKTMRDTLVYIVEEITMELGDEEKAHFVRGMSIDGGSLDVSVANWQEHLNRLVQHWASQMVLTPDQVAVLEKLIEDRHNLLQSAYEVYASDEDENELLDTLQRIAKLQLQAEEGAALQMFSQVVNDHCDVLRENEKALVKQLFVRKSELVRAAWEVFEVEKNVHDLGDTLLRIARFTSRNDSKLRLVEVVGEMMRRQLIRSHEADGLIRLYEEKNEAMLAANEAFASDGDVKELVETLLLVVKHANFGEAPTCSPRHAFHRTRAPSLSLSFSANNYEPGTEEFLAARLIEVLGIKGRLTEWQTELLLALLTQNDDRLLAAIDVYNEDQNARELVDTLWRLCDLLVWEENKRSIIQEWILPLEKQGRVKPPGSLAKLIQARDDRVMAAFIVYLENSNGQEFADTLERIARIEAKTKHIGITSVSSTTQDADSEFNVDAADKILLSLVKNGIVSADEQQAVQHLYKAHDAQVLAAFDVYCATEDSEDFVDTLKRVLARSSSRSSASPSPSKSKIARMEKQLLHFASELELAPDELAALKRSIARQDEILEAAVEVYEVEKDEVNF